MLAWLNGLRLSLVQWLLLSAASAVGILIALLRLRGGQLHAAKVALLREQFGRAMDQQDARVERAKDRFRKAQREYEESR